MMKFLLFLYAVSVVIFFAIFVALNNETLELYKKYEIEKPKQGLLRKLGGWLFLVLVSLLPVFRALWASLFLVGYITKKEELEGKEREVL